MPEIYVRDQTFRFGEHYRPVQADRMLMQAVVDAWPNPPAEFTYEQLTFVLNARAADGVGAYLNYDVYAPSLLPWKNYGRSE